MECVANSHSAVRQVQDGNGVKPMAYRMNRTKWSGGHEFDDGVWKKRPGSRLEVCLGGL